MATTLSLRRLWAIYKRTAVTRSLSKRELASTQLAFYSGARGVLKVLAYLIEHGDYEELHDTIKFGTKTESRPRKRGSSSDVNCYCVVPLLEKAEGECISSLGLLHPLPLPLRHHKLRLLLCIAAMLAWSA